jgi:hypothetical protein
MDYVWVFVLLIVVIIVIVSIGTGAAQAITGFGIGSAIGRAIMGSSDAAGTLPQVSNVSRTTRAPTSDMMAVECIQITPGRSMMNTHGGRSRTTHKGDIIKVLAVHPRSRSEQNAVTILESVTGASFPTVNPAWLVWKGKTLELDGYNAQLRLALEFSGPLHTKWFPQKEPYSAYFDRITKDVVKLRICKREHVNLIVLDMSLPSHHWRNYLLSRLYDSHATMNGALIVPERPDAYIEAQTADPFRNEQIERELGLTGDMSAALRL